MKQEHKDLVDEKGFINDKNLLLFFAISLYV